MLRRSLNRFPSPGSALKSSRQSRIRDAGVEGIPIPAGAGFKARILDFVVRVDQLDLERVRRSPEQLRFDTGIVNRTGVLQVKAAAREGLCLEVFKLCIVNSQCESERTQVTLEANSIDVEISASKTESKAAGMRSVFVPPDLKPVA